MVCAVVCKIGFSQDYKWAKSIGSTADDYGYGIATGAYSNVYITGKFVNTADFDPGADTANLISNGSDDIFFAKYDSSGSYVWAKSIGSASSADGGWDITTDVFGNIYITGFFNDTADFDPGPGTANLISTAGYDIFIAKYDSSGSYLWAKSIAGSGGFGYSIATDAYSNVYITGRFVNTADFDPDTGTANLTSIGIYDIFFAKYDSLGNYLWANSIGSGTADAGNCIDIDTLGNVYITGYWGGTADFDPGVGTVNLTPVGSYDIFFAKYDPSGNYLWAKGIGSTLWDQGQGIHIGILGNIYITGYYEGTADFDPGAGNAYLTPGNNKDIFFAKYDSNGNYIFAKSSSSTSSNNGGNSITTDDDGNVYITGYFKDSVDFDPSTDTASLTTAGSFVTDIFFAKYDSSGNYLWAKSIEGASVGVGYSISLDGVNNIYVAGVFKATTDFDPGTGSATLTSNGGYDIFLAKYIMCNINSSFTPTATIICAGITVNFTNTSTGATAYMWQEDGTPFSTAADTSRTFANAGTYTISLIANYESCSDSSSVIITVNPTYSYSDPAVDICNGDSMMIFGNYQTTAGTYYDSLITVNGCDSIHSVVLMANPIYSISDSPLDICNGDSVLIYGTYRNTAGTYYDSLTTIDGCDSTFTTNLTVDTCVGIHNFEFINGLKIYPNPNTGKFNIEMDIAEAENFELRIFNNLGQEIFTEKLTQFKGIYEKEIDLSTYAAGLYNLQLSSGNERIISNKIVFEK